jgi:WD40 repeat protein
VECESYAGSITSVSFSLDGLQVATSGKDGVVKIWNPEGQQLTQFKTYQRSIEAPTSCLIGSLLQQALMAQCAFGSMGKSKIWTVCLIMVVISSTIT